MEVLDIVVHASCAVMFVGAGLASKGNRGVAAALCTGAIVLECMIWTGALGSLLAMVK